MAKHYLYLLVSLFIFINGVGYFEGEIVETVKRKSLLVYKLKKQRLYASNIKEVESILDAEEKIFSKNSFLFFEKDKKETIVFSDMQQYIQSISKEVDAKIGQLNSGIVIDSKLYKKYPIMLNLKLIPEDLDRFFNQLYKSKKYFFIESIQISINSRQQLLQLKTTLMGYQLK